MKRKLVTLTLAFVMIGATAFATNGPKVSEKILASFNKEFPGAQHVKWNESNDYLSAVFVLSDFRAEAWFDVNGELLGTSRDLLYNQLPLAVMRSIESRFPDASPIEVKEITNSNGTSYRLVLDTKKVKYTVKSNADGEIYITDKTKK